MYALLLVDVTYSSYVDEIEVGKELRLKQQYFWTAASLADILRRFKNMEKPITEFPECEGPWINPHSHLLTVRIIL